MNDFVQILNNKIPFLKTKNLPVKSIDKRDALWIFHLDNRGWEENYYLNENSITGIAIENGKMTIKQDLFTGHKVETEFVW